MTTMQCWRVTQPGPIGTAPLQPAESSVPDPGPGELLVRVLACGVCRTDLHVAEGDLPVRQPSVVPGHEVVGEVMEVGPLADNRLGTHVDSLAGTPDGELAVGDRVGIAWLRHTCGTCRYCLRGAENLCPSSRFTGWDADGGYAEYATVPSDYVYRLPAGYDDVELAPLLCAGIIGYRALERAALPPGGRLGIYGFGASAHLTAQVALARGATVHVVTRGAAARELAVDLGASSVSGPDRRPPEPLDAAILFAPAGALVPVALAALDRGGTLAVAGVHLTDVPPLVYEDHLFYERQIRSVTSNTRGDGRAFLAFAANHRLEVVTSRYPLAAASRALAELAIGRVRGAAVLVP